MSEPRKATDVLLALEAKIDILLQMCRTQDLNIKILSNKFNILNEEFKSLIIEEESETEEQVTTVSIKSNLQIPIETKPDGFRRTARPETFAPAEISPPSEELLFDPRKSKTIPKNLDAPMIAIPVNPTVPPIENVSKSPVIQRVLDKNGKSVFLAEVKITNMKTEQIEYSGRTSGVGKWQATLSPGIYKVQVTKHESVSKQKMIAYTEFTVPTSGTLLTLPDLIVK